MGRIAKVNEQKVNKPEIPTDDASYDGPLDATVLEKFEEKNVLAIDRMEKVVERLKDMMDSPKKRKILYIRLALYIAQFIIIVLITSQVPNPWAAIAVSCLIAYVTTVAINIIVKRLEIQENFGEMGQDTSRVLVQSVISSFPLMPAMIQDNLVSFAYKGETAKRYKDIKSLRKYKDTVEEFLQARRSYRAGEIAEANKLIKKVILKAKWAKFNDLLTEAEPFRSSVEQQLNAQKQQSDAWKASNDL